MVSSPQSAIGGRCQSDDRGRGRHGWLKGVKPEVEWEGPRPNDGWGRGGAPGRGVLVERTAVDSYGQNMDATCS